MLNTLLPLVATLHLHQSHTAGTTQWVSANGVVLPDLSAAGGGIAAQQVLIQELDERCHRPVQVSVHAAELLNSICAAAAAQIVALGANLQEDHHHGAAQVCQSRQDFQNQLPSQLDEGT